MKTTTATDHLEIHPYSSGEPLVTGHHDRRAAPHRPPSVTIDPDDEPVLEWPDPSPLDSWWAMVMQRDPA